MYFSLFMVVLRALNTVIEGRASDARHAIRNSDGGKTAATLEGRVPYARHIISLARVSNCTGNNDRAEIGFVTCRCVSHLGIAARNAVINTTHRKIIGECHLRQHHTNDRK